MNNNTLKVIKINVHILVYFLLEQIWIHFHSSYFYTHFVEIYFNKGLLWKKLYWINLHNPIFFIVFTI